MFSRILTDADSYWGNNTTSTGNGCCLAADQYNRRLEKSIGQFDQTHNFKTGFVLESPFGKDKPYLNHGVGAWLLGNWGPNGVLTYGSGHPVGITSSYVLPLYPNTNGRSTPYVTSYTGWQPNWGGKFDPTIDNFFVPYCNSATASCSGPFPFQNLNSPLNGFGNVTRYDAVVRQFPALNENLAIARAFPIRESIRLQFRAEAFNIFNRTRFGTGPTQLQGPEFRATDEQQRPVEFASAVAVGVEAIFLREGIRESRSQGTAS